MKKKMTIGRASLPILGTLSLLVACGKTEHRSADQASDKNTSTAAAGAQRSAATDFVSAVSGGTAEKSRAVNLQFALREKPEVGKPTTIEIALTPSVELERVLATFQPSEGLDLTEGAKMPMYEHPKPGVTLAHKLTIVPQRNGIFYVAAVVLADSKETSVARNFSIPVIAGEGLGGNEEATVTSTPEVATEAAPVSPAADSRQRR